MIRHFMLAAVLCTAVGCNVGNDGFAPEDDHFVETMVELRRAAIEAGRDTARFEQRRQEILDQRGVTEDSLRSYVARRSVNLQEMAAIWDSVNSRLTVERIP